MELSKAEQERRAHFNNARLTPIFIEMSERLRNTCLRSGFYTIEMLKQNTREGLLARYGWGPKQVDELEMLLHKHGERFERTTCKECGRWK